MPPIEAANNQGFCTRRDRLRPWRCSKCDRRFYAHSVPLKFVRYAHCRRCGNFDLQRIAGAKARGRALRLAAPDGRRGSLPLPTLPQPFFFGAAVFQLDTAGAGIQGRTADAILFRFRLAFIQGKNGNASGTT